MRSRVAFALPWLVTLVTTEACLDWNSGHRSATEPDDAAIVIDDAGAPDAREAEEPTRDASVADGEDAEPDVSVPDEDEPDAASPDGAASDASDASDAAVGPASLCPADACPAEFPCVGTADDFFCRGQFAEFPLPSRRAGTSLAAQQFELNQPDGTVLDLVTGLEWQRAFVSPGQNQADARAYCASLPVGGHGDFRLPSVHELITLFGSELGSDLDTKIFLGVSTTYSYWTSTPDTERTVAGHFSLYFGDYALSSYEATELRGALCVRTRQRKTPVGTPATRFALEAGGLLVRDTHTDVHWLRDLSLGSSALTFAQARDYCARLTTGGHTFRLPSVPEALSIYDYSQVPGQRVPAPFTGRSAAVWTRTELSWNAELGRSDQWTAEVAGWIRVTGTSDPTSVAGARCVAVP